MAFSFSRAEVEALLRAEHEIDPAKRPAFAARMRHLQRHGFPPGTNTGKGRKAEYGIDQVVLLGIAFELLQLGVTPERAASVLSANAEVILAEAKSAVRAYRRSKAERLLLIDPRALSSIQAADAGRHDFLMVGGYKDLMDRFRSRAVAPRIAIIDIKTLILFLVQILETSAIRPPNVVLDAFAKWAAGK